ncbi:flagellar hook capping FlgD N-terminal domain-containing protein [Vibrio mediterranei]|uniref:Basal-body rod modification protein FlgD n=1 Tax=Vibrio mediterranei TaxID=689 RepID=A0ABX5DIV7_9VIBR|nr:flagellar hook capping FlgD N-terminal domain-containing protein [Vibrio mediterranei]PCD90269.1 flagellar basal body rod modification protein [Vibrio mediterranei]PRQ69655.1 flagellar basal body rod modification protein [Vibrio mediterranei]
MTTISGAAQVNNIESASTLPPQENPNSAGALKNEFITLMVAQIENQDPLNPTDGTEYVAQLAQFSQVESTENLVQLTQNNTTMLDNLQVLSTAALVDKTVTVKSDQLSASGEGTHTGYVQLQAASNTVTVELVNHLGQVKTVALGPNSAGRVDFAFDAKAMGLNGSYQMNVILDSGQNYQPAIYQHGKVEQVTTPLVGGTSHLQVQGVGMVAFYDVAAFSN